MSQPINFRNKITTAKFHPYQDSVLLPALFFILVCHLKMRYVLKELKNVFPFPITPMPDNNMYIRNNKRKCFFTLNFLYSLQRHIIIFECLLQGSFRIWHTYILYYMQIHAYMKLLDIFYIYMVQSEKLEPIYTFAYANEPCND